MAFVNLSITADRELLRGRILEFEEGHVNVGDTIELGVDLGGVSRLTVIGLDTLLAADTTACFGDSTAFDTVTGALIPGHTLAIGLFLDALEAFAGCSILVLVEDAWGVVLGMVGVALFELNLLILGLPLLGVEGGGGVFRG